MIQKTTTRELLSNYDFFICDLWGVIHDGNFLYPYVMDFLKEVQKQGKTLVFLSNAPRRADKVKAVLEGKGITPDLYQGIFSSGEVFFQDATSLQKKGVIAGNHYFYIGPDKDSDIMHGNKDFISVDSAAHADFALLTGVDNEFSTIDEVQHKLEEAISAGLLMMCVNPDKKVVKENPKDGTSRFMLCAGAIADVYEEIGGIVEYYGKPYTNVYKYLEEKYHINKAKTIAIGDGIETDIDGANNFGIDSVLVTYGIHKKEIIPNSAGEFNIEQVKQVFADHDVTPAKFFMDSLEV